MTPTILTRFPTTAALALAAALLSAPAASGDTITEDTTSMAIEATQREQSMSQVLRAARKQTIITSPPPMPGWRIKK